MHGVPADNEISDSTTDANISEIDVAKEGSKVLTESDFATMLGGFQGQVFQKTWNVSIHDFCNCFVNATQISGSFTKAELITAIKPVLDKLNAFGENVLICLSEHKHQIVTSFPSFWEMV